MSRKIGKYVLGATIGEGGFSKVKLGVDPDSKEKVAIKILKKKGLELSESSKKQVEREISAMSKIKHQNVLSLKDYDWNAKYTHSNGKSEDALIIILELATGGELFDYLSFTGPFEEKIARTYFHQLIAGVECCHSNGIAHRDLKPENLLLSSDFVLKLADFGFANLIPEDNMMSTECGTRGYMAPEMYGKKGYDAKAVDIWACGVILFITLAGFPPFQMPVKSDWWYDKLLNNKHHLFWQAHCRTAYFSDKAKDLINKVFNPDPKKRLTLEEIKKHDWFQGSVLSQDELVAELQKRKVAVDDEKAKDQDKLQHGDNSDIFDDTKMRSLDAQSADLPSGVPRFVIKKNFNANANANALNSFGSFGDNSFAALAQSSVEAPAPPKYDKDLNVECYSKFYSSAEPSKLAARITEVLAAIKAQYSAVEAEYKYKASVITSIGEVLFTVEVFSDPETKLYLVEFRRRNGDTLQFQQVYQAISRELADLAVKNPSKASEDVEMKIEEVKASK